MRVSVRALGLNLESDIPLEGAPPAEGPIDVKIRLGACPEGLADPRVACVRFQASPGELLLTVDGIGRFLVRRGNEIIVSPLAEVGPSQLEPFLFGSAFGALLHQRGVLPLHASAVEIDGGCGVLAGVSATGKSTLAWALARRGLRFLTDDVCPVFREGEVSLAQPGLPRLKLCADMADRFSLSAPTLMSESGKTVVSLTPVTRPLRVRRIVSLSIGGGRPSLGSLDGAAKLEALIGRTYRRLFIDGLAVRESHFRACQALAAQAEVFALRRPETPDVLDEVVDLVHRRLVA